MVKDDFSNVHDFNNMSDTSDSAASILPLDMVDSKKRFD